MHAAPTARTSTASWRGLSLDERYFLRIAQKNRLVSEHEIAEILSAKRALSERGRQRSVQEIMLDAGMLSPEQVDAIHEAQAASQTIRLDSLYADIAVRLGVADRAVLERMFEIQRRRGYKVRVGELLVDRGLISSSQHRQILTELLQSLRADEREYMRTIGLKRRLSPEPLDPKQAEDRLRLMQTQAAPPSSSPSSSSSSSTVRTQPRQLGVGRTAADATAQPEKPVASSPQPQAQLEPTASLQDWLGRSSSTGSRAASHAASRSASEHQEPRFESESGPIPIASSDDELVFPASDDAAVTQDDRIPAAASERLVDLSESEEPIPSFLQSNITRIREQARAHPGSASTTRSVAKTRSKRRRSARGPRPHPPETTDMHRLLESAMDVLEEEREEGSLSDQAQREAIDAVEDDLRDVDELIGKGYRSFKELTRRASDASRGEAFSTERYLRRRRRRTLMTRLLILGVLIGVLVPTGLGVYFARKNSRRLHDAEAALAAGRLTEAARLLDETGTFWVGKQAIEQLRNEIELAKAIAPIDRLRDQGRFTEALGALERVRNELPGHVETFARLEREIRLQAALAEGLEHERRGDLVRAIESYRRAAVLAPKSEAPQQRIDAIRTRLRDEIVAAEASAAAMPDDEAAQARKLVSYRRYLEVFPGEGKEIERKLLEQELRLNLAEAKRAVAAERYEAALAFFYRAGSAAEALNEPGRRAEIEERIRATHRLVRYSKSLEQAALHERAGRFEEAIRSYRQAAAWIPENDPRAQTLREKIEHCRRQMQERSRTERSRRLWNEAIEALRASRIAQAQAALEALVELDPHDAKAKRTLRFAKRLTDMVYIPAGSSVIGTDFADAPAARPQHTVELPAFFIDRFEVRNRDFAAWVKATGARRPSHWRTQPGTDEAKLFAHEQADHPVVDVSFEEAKAYARWLGKRLPTEFEWEKAARGGDDRTWPWGNDTQHRRVNVAAQTSERLPIHTKPVGTSADDRSPYGCMDMAGNVSEWTDSRFEPYPGADPKAAPFDADRHVIRGGSWRYGLHYARAFNRDRASADTRSPYLGFRCALDVPEWLPELRK